MPATRPFPTRSLPTRRRTGLLAAAVAAALAAVSAGSATTASATPTSATAVSATTGHAAPRPHVRFVAHLDLAGGQRPENIALEPGGGTVVTFAFSRQVARIAPDGTVRVLATLPEPPAGSATPVLSSPFLGGIVRAHDGTLYFLYATGSGDLTGLWRLRPGGTPHRIAALPAGGLPNGLAFGAGERELYITDSVLGTVWRVPVTGGTPTRWAATPELAPAGFLGANGVKIHHGAAWVTNLDRGTVLRVPITRRGTAGPVETRATGLAGIDDFAFTGRGDTLLAAVNEPNVIALVRPDGTHRTVLTGADGLQNPTSLAVRGGTVLVAGGAYFTDQDPNLLAARLR
ncbi:SMP-30/gluconolactonase/LRE family protein [Streptomyces sp. NPDC048182]|uniref:SMP-30/gluconolactonase/LRE family protein n=1 Tax=Streptomyces sp. NPDC048182 TaxID=3365507 RepID=UPI003714D7CD